MEQEPSVLDYVKAILTPWRGARPEIPPLDVTESFSKDLQFDLFSQEKEEKLHSQAEQLLDIGKKDLLDGLKSIRWQWLLALLFALLAQSFLEPPEPKLLQGLIFYGIAAIFCFWAFLYEDSERSSLSFIEHQTGITENEVSYPEPFLRHPNYAAIGAILCVVSFLTFGGNLFNLFNFSTWIIGTVFIISAFWQPSKQSVSFWHRLSNYFNLHQWNISISRWTVLFLLVFIVAAFFRFYKLNDIPPEMISDHAEKLLDIHDVLNGQPHIFFPRNTGREAFQMYLTAAIILVFNTGFSFISLKIGTVLAGLFTLPYIYLIGKEFANRRVGLFAMLFAGIAYWHNVISRVALRFSLYPLFFAPTLYYLIRGLRYRKLNDFILSGIFLGIGLHGYSTMRIVPFIIVLLIGVFLCHKPSKGWRKTAMVGLLLLSVISLIVFIPLLRYSIENPDMVSYRAITRLSTTERTLPGSPVNIFFDNLGKASVMFFWDNGEIWPHSVPHRPALDIVSASLLFLGVVFLLLRYIRQRDWLDISMILSIPLLMLPSILSLAFPAENPSLNRTGGAIIPVFVIVGFALDRIYSALAVNGNLINKINIKDPEEITYQKKFPILASFVLLILISWSMLQNYDLVFKQYYELYRQSSWNTSEMGQVINGFAKSIGNENQAWVVGYPYWVDTRLVGINAGFPTHDYAIWPDQIDITLNIPGEKLFLIKPEDSKGLEALQRVYPQGVLQSYKSKVETKDFLMYLVPER